MNIDGAGQAAFFTSEANGNVRCHLCPHGCVIARGSAGKCNVRMNQDGVLYLTVWGRPAALQIHAIESMPLYHFLPGTETFCIGTAGCTMDCAFCNTSEIVSLLPNDLPFIPLDPEAVVTRARDNGCATISFAFNEPVACAEYMMAVSREAARTELKCVAFTNAFISRPVIRDVFRDIHAANVGIKAFEVTMYRDFCKGRLDDVLRSTLELAELGLHLELTMAVIPGLNDSTRAMQAMAAWIRDSLGMDTPLHLVPFQPSHRLTTIRKPDTQSIDKLAAAARNEGLRHVYGGTPDSAFCDTKCHKCGRVMIHRNGSTFMSIDVPASRKCPDCGTPLLMVDRRPS